MNSSGATPPPRWRRWFAGMVAVITSFGFGLVKLQLIPPTGLGRTGALMMILVAAPYGLRAFVHVRIGYLMGRGNDETRGETRKRLTLGGLVMLDFVTAAALATAGVAYLLQPDNWQELGVAAAAVVLIALSSDATIRLIEYFGLPRGSEVIERCRIVAWLRELAEHLRDVPGVSKLDSLWDKRTMQHRVSWLVVVLLSVLAGTVFAQVVAVFPEIESYFNHSHPARGAEDDSGSTGQTGSGLEAQRPRLDSNQRPSA